MLGLKWALPAALSVVGAAAATPAVAANANAGGRAIVVTPLSLVKVDDLDFGSVVPSPLSGVIIIDAASGALSAIGGVTAYGTALAHRAYFVGAGTEGQSVTITLGPAPLLTDGSGNSMSVLALTLDGPVIRIIPADQAVHVRVGGILLVNANQAPGGYAGTFTMTMNYN